MSSKYTGTETGLTQWALMNYKSLLRRRLRCARMQLWIRKMRKKGDGLSGWRSRMGEVRGGIKMLTEMMVDGC